MLQAHWLSAERSAQKIGATNPKRRRRRHGIRKEEKGWPEEVVTVSRLGSQRTEARAG